MMIRATLLTDLEEFIAGHRAHGILACEMGDLTHNGYRLRVRCHCGVVFKRWITPEEAERDLILLARRN